MLEDEISLLFSEKYKMNDFIFPRLSVKNLDRYVIRRAIFDALQSNLNHFKGDFLDAGCGKMPYRDFILKNSEVKNYIGLDIEGALVYDKNIRPDIFWDGAKMPFDDNSFDTIMATEVLEHVFEPSVFLKESFRVLKTGGVFFFTVPFLWNLHETPNDHYRYTPFSLEKLLKKAGFAEIEIKPTGGWHASFAQMMGLWVRRSGISPQKKKWISRTFKPFIKYLLKKDAKTIPFTEGLMITGLFGIAKKIRK